MENLTLNVLIFYQGFQGKPFIFLGECKESVNLRERFINRNDSIRKLQKQDFGEILKLGKFMRTELNSFYVSLKYLMFVLLVDLLCGQFQRSLWFFVQINYSIITAKENIDGLHSLSFQKSDQQKSFACICRIKSTLHK